MGELQTTDQKEQKGLSCICQKTSTVDDAQDVWDNIPWTNESKVHIFRRHGSHFKGCKANTPFHQIIIIPTVKHIDGSAMVWGCFAFARPGQLVIIDRTMSFPLYQKILEENVWPSVCDLKLKCRL